MDQDGALKDLEKEERRRARRVEKKRLRRLEKEGELAGLQDVLLPADDFAPLPQKPQHPQHRQ